MQEIHQGDIIIIDAEPHAGKEIGGHNPKQGNIRRPFIVLSNYNYNRLTHLVQVMPITHVHKESPLRLRIVDYATKINGDVLTHQLPMYSFEARHGEVIGHLNDTAMLRELLRRTRNMFEEE